MTTSTTTNRYQKAAASSSAKKAAAPAHAPVVNETTPMELDGEENPVRQQVKRQSLYGFIMTVNKKFIPAQGEKKAVLFMSIKTKAHKVGLDDYEFVDVKVFGKQAEFLNANLAHNIPVVARGYFADKPPVEGKTTTEQIFILNDNFGITLPVPKMN